MGFYPEMSFPQEKGLFNFFELGIILKYAFLLIEWMISKITMKKKIIIALVLILIALGGFFVEKPNLISLNKDILAEYRNAHHGEIFILA